MEKRHKKNPVLGEPGFLTPVKGNNNEVLIMNHLVAATNNHQTGEIMNQMTNFINTEKTMSTREIAVLVEKQHSNIKISAERLAEKGVIGTLAMQEFIHNGNKYTEYLLGKRDSLILVAQNCPEFTARIVDRWQELENQQPALPDFANPAEAARAWAEQFEKNQMIAKERDDAIRTKAQISSSREASVMGKLGALTRKLKQVEGRSAEYATVTAVQAKVSGLPKMPHLELQKWCRDNNAEPKHVPCNRYGQVRTWPADAWAEAHGVDIKKLFGGEQ